MTYQGNYNGSNKRKRAREMLSGLYQLQDDNDSPDEDNAKKVQFRDDLPLILKTSTKLYTCDKCDYDEVLIGSPQHWHQVTVSLTILLKK